MKIACILALLILSSITFAQEAVRPRYMNFLYRVEQGDTFASILRMYIKDDSIINKTTPLVQKNINFNRHVKDWGKLTPGTLISIYIPEDMLDMNKYKSKQEIFNKKNEEVMKVILEKSGPPEGFKGSLFYMASLGDFTQSSEGTKVAYKQNSPVTLGIQSNYFPKNSLYSFSASTYFSIFSPAETILAPYSVKLPPELGLNFYTEYLWQKPLISWHAGLDYEKFSAFNIQGIFNDRQFYLDRVSVVYLTAGLSHVFNIFNNPFYVKASLSKSVSSTSTSEYAGAINSKPMNGAKVLFYLNYKFTDKLFLHSLLKIHSMTGPSDLTSIRLGVGVGYILF